MILIQEIRSVWTKASRGGESAARRNSVPEAAPLPALGSKSTRDKIFHQILVYVEANDFAAPVKSEFAEYESESIIVGCVKIHVAPERLVVAYEYDYKSGGAPRRRGRRGEDLREEVIVERGSWARVKYNGRFTGDEWWYEKVVVNVALCKDNETGAFYSGVPPREIAHMARLR